MFRMAIASCSLSDRNQRYEEENSGFKDKGGIDFYLSFDFSDYSIDTCDACSCGDGNVVSKSVCP